jgi:hypothetical protein
MRSFYIPVNYIKAALEYYKQAVPTALMIAAHATPVNGNTYPGWNLKARFLAEIDTFERKNLLFKVKNKYRL